MEVTARVHAYMLAHPESELHRQGKMFGVLVYNELTNERVNELRSEGRNEFTKARYIAAFSAQLDGSYHHEGFVPPVYEMPAPPVGTSKAESQRLQRLLFSKYTFLNTQGERKNLLDIFAHEKPILSEEEWFSRLPRTAHHSALPPGGAGECCAPKLLQYAFEHGLQPYALAEFWIGASPANDIRQEGLFYPPCSGRCVPILRHMLLGIELTGEGMNELTSERVNELANERPEVIYEDEWLMVVNKPSGLLSVPGKGDEPSVESIVHAKAVHRLDQDTSGLLVLAKTPDVYKTLQAYFQRRDILKRYEAVVKPNDEMRATALLNDTTSLPIDGMIDLPLLPDPYDRPRQMVNRSHGKPSLTRYVLREQRPDGTILVDFYPLTGRTHQLRVHAAHVEGLNAPIVGDRLYGQPAERLMLHAAEIRFVHPATKKEMHFCIPSNF